MERATTAVNTSASVKKASTTAPTISAEVTAAARSELDRVMTSPARVRSTEPIWLLIPFDMAS